MEQEELSQILLSFGVDTKFIVEHIGSGLIHKTWKIKIATGEYILQQVNDKVFKTPSDIEQNIRLISNYLQKRSPAYLFVSPIEDIEGNQLLFKAGLGYFRLFPFVEDSITFDVLSNPSQAYEAARQFGRFTKQLSGFDAAFLKLTIPQFHDLELRFEQFNTSLQKGNKERVLECDRLINKILGQYSIVEKYKQVKLNPFFKLRVIHHDTKISNVLFNEQGKGICVIDLDTVMPGYFISDVGDMMRTYLSPVTEEESDTDKISIREEFYKAIADGYLSEMAGELNEYERSYFFYSGEFMIYMQALRFITDYINDDVYYGAAYPGHNYIRALNQLTLLTRYQEKKDLLEKYTPHI